MDRKKNPVKSEIVALLITLALVTFARSSLADHYYVPTGSMEYTLMPGDRVLVDKTAYGFRIPLTKFDLFGAATPERGDIAVFDSPVDGKRLIKRIVAVGGDIVRLQDGHLSINGEMLGDERIEEFGGREAIINLEQGGGPDIRELTIPEGSVLALGDHRGDSYDGRFFGLIDETELFGRAIGIYYRRGDGFTWLSL